jgi:hypothetical protein
MDMFRMTAVGIAAVMLGLTVWPGGHARAQYPAPAGNVTVTASETTATVGGSVTISATVRDVNGDPVAERRCLLVIARQPGTDASLTPASATTDASGVVTATLEVGSSPGIIEVTITCGSVSGNVSVVAGAATAPEQGAPPASPIELPNTGDGGTAAFGGHRTATGLWLGAVAVLLLFGVGRTARRLRRR